MENILNGELPSDLEFAILSRLPIKSLFRFRCVSKTWRTEIIGRDFSELYQHQNKARKHNDNNGSLIVVTNTSISTFDYSTARRLVYNLRLPPDFHQHLRNKIVGSSNGLICFEDIHGRNFSIYNPVTGYLKVVPHLTPYEYCSIGFGFEHKRNDYNILLFCGGDSFYIYSLRTDTWDEIEQYHCVADSKYLIYSNNAVHWLGTVVEFELVIRTVIAFDLRSEQFYHLSNLVDIRGRLHLVISPECRGTGTLGMEIWVMKKYRVEKSWTNLINYSLDEISTLFQYDRGPWTLRPRVYASSRNGREILVGLERHPRHLFSCDLQTREVKRVIDVDNLSRSRSNGFYVAPWSPSLFTL